MRIVFLSPGAAGMYCGSCLHDNTLANALRKRGEDILLAPIYTPLRVDEPDASQRRVFFGGINVYLQQQFSLFRHTPWLLDRLWDLPGLIRWATRGSQSVDARQLGELTDSMLQGPHGRQRKELAKLVHWLKHDIRPQIIHLSNALLLGMAGELHRALDCPIVCNLSGEDIFIERLLPTYRKRVVDRIHEAAKHVQAFIALNHYYAQFATDAWSLDPARVHVIPHGVHCADYLPRASGNRERLVIGFLARICPEKGPHLLLEACDLLQRDPAMPPFEVRIAGYPSPQDQAYVAELPRRASQWSDRARLTMVGEVDRPGKLAFLSELDVMCVPTFYRESKGMSLLEAQAAGVPIVVPAHGAFPEMVAATQGGVLFEPGNAVALAEQLGHLLLDADERERLGQAGRLAACTQFSPEKMAITTCNLYNQLAAAAGSPGDLPIGEGGQPRKKDSSRRNPPGPGVA